MSLFAGVSSIDTLLADLPRPDAASIYAAQSRHSQLTKPPGSLGRLEEIGVWLSGWQRTPRPSIETITIIIFAGNHGVTDEGISPYPASVTAQMVANYQAGGAAINALSSCLGHRLVVVPMDLDRPTGNIAIAPAMTEAECLGALNTGASAVSEAGGDLLVLGEMGIGNTTIAAALAAASLGGTGTDWAGRGTGLDDAGVARKAKVIDRALALHRQKAWKPFEVLRRLGGRETAAIAGAVIAARLVRRPVVLDGFVVTAALAPLARTWPEVLAHTIAGHCSAESGHRRLLEALGLMPLLDLGMRLGEATGASLAASLVRAAATVQSDMATFAGAGVSDRIDGA